MLRWAAARAATNKPRRHARRMIWFGALCVVICSLAVSLAIIADSRRPPLLLAPMIGGLEPCLFEASLSDAAGLPPGGAPCETGEHSAAKRVEATLKRFGPVLSTNGKYEMGYTLNAPLLRFLRLRGPEWELDLPAIQNLVRTIREVERPVILYLFSNHFGVGAPIEEVLAGDPANLLKTAQGPMGKDKYYSVDIYPWSFATTRNEITRQREKVVHAILDEMCKLPQEQLAKVRGVTLLGELHHMFPNFEGGMGFSGRYLVSDYSPGSIAEFRKFLASRFISLSALNQALDADFARLEDVSAPSKNIRNEPLNKFSEHIDSFAHGELPISGWAIVPGRASKEPLWIRVYRNGEFVARVPVSYARQDVLHAYPAFNTADVGWIYNLDYTKLPRGMHLISVYLEQEREPLVHLASRRIAIMDKHQIAPAAMELTAEPPSVKPDASVRFHVDYPADLSSYYFNPLVVLWHEFRSTQVRDYLAHFQSLVERSCLAPRGIFAHQILPFSNPGWDSGKFAVGSDLGIPAKLGLGVSLYGEASYGHSFFDWLDASQRTEYGVTEFHPLRALDSGSLSKVLARHRQSGARFVSFFAEPALQNSADAKVANIFSFDPKNRNFGSDALAESIKKIMN
jgi:hypothetical protein